LVSDIGNDCLRRNQECLVILAQLQIYSGEQPGNEFGIASANDRPYLERPRILIDAVFRRHNDCVMLLPASVYPKFDCISLANVFRVLLRYRELQLELIDLPDRGYDIRRGYIRTQADVAKTDYAAVG